MILWVERLLGQHVYFMQMLLFWKVTTSAVFTCSSTTKLTRESTMYDLLYSKLSKAMLRLASMNVIDFINFV